ncbi:hypothetical protein OUZ56_006288 [Daphnia magna]|uniref:Uncharacterized protein n=1 Tax=Daphnia magna TaxID=35525 RepID=A0ABQ9YWJ2_9CRUS|nr:hypothetical protein OUZ56_006288 [Daphnia magna]
MAATRIGSWKLMHVRLDVALHVGGPVGNGKRINKLGSQTGHLMIRVHSSSAWVPQEGIAEHNHP